MSSGFINSEAKRERRYIANTAALIFKKDVDYGIIERKTILETMMKQLKIEMKSFRIMNRTESLYIQAITFYDHFDASTVFGTEIEFDGKFAKLVDYNKEETKTYKILYLDNLEDLEETKIAFLNKLDVIEEKCERKSGTESTDRRMDTTKKNKVKVTKLEYEKYRDRDYPVDEYPDLTMETGNIIISIKCNRGMKLKDIRGYHEFNGQRAKIIQYRVDKRKCYGCGDSNHLKAKCPDADKTCDKCKKKGHVTEKCRVTYASKTNPEQQDKDDEDMEFHNDDVIDEEEKQAKAHNEENENQSLNESSLTIQAIKESLRKIKDNHEGTFNTVGNANKYVPRPPEKRKELNSSTSTLGSSPATPASKKKAKDNGTEDESGEDEPLEKETI